jgi:hypothetical protein
LNEDGELQVLKMGINVQQNIFFLFHFDKIVCMMSFLQAKDERLLIFSSLLCTVIEKALSITLEKDGRFF